MVDTPEAAGGSPWNFPAPDFAPLKQSWDQFLGDPKGQAALLSFAAQALQPRQFGQTAAGSLGESLAKGGEAIRGIDTQEEKSKELQSKQDLREAQSNVAAARADTATTRSDLAGTRLAFQQQEGQRKQEMGQTQNILAAQRQYQMEKKAIEDRNAKGQRDAGLLNTPFTPTPVPTIQQWIAARPHLHGIFAGSPSLADTGQGSGGTTPPVGATPPQSQFTPPSTWQRSPSTGYFRDPTTKKVYDSNGIEVQ